MLSIEECKKTLNQEGIIYTDNEIKEIRDFLYAIGNIDYRMFLQKIEQEKLSEVKVVYLNNANNENNPGHDKESDSLHQGIYRRTG